MKTDDILNLDCTVYENRLKLNKFLYKVGYINGMCTNEDLRDKPIVNMSILENAFFDMCTDQGYMQQGIKQYFENGRFIYHYASIVHKGDVVRWCGNVYGKDMWELLAKMVIKIYADIMKKGKENGK